MKAQRELFERQIELEAAELAVSPEEEIAELALIYRAKGLNKDDADRLARPLTEDPEIALDTLVREELGLDPTNSVIRFNAAISPSVPSPGRGAAGGALLLRRLGPDRRREHRAVLVALFSVGALLSVFTGQCGV